MSNTIINIEELPITSNQDLSYLQRPKRLTLDEFNEFPVTESEAILREKIYKLEELMFIQPDALFGEALNNAMTPIHKFTPGIYTRELAIPPGQIVMGKRHAIEHQVMLIKGSCICITERGIEYMTAPMHFISPAGEKRVVITTDEEAVWVTIHASDKTDLDELEQDIIIAEPKRMQQYMIKREMNTNLLEGDNL